MAVREEGSQSSSLVFSHSQTKIHAPEYDRLTAARER